MDVVCQSYGSDFDRDTLQFHVDLMRESGEGESITNMSKLTQHLKVIPPVQKQLLSLAIHLAKLVLVMPATNASSERAFSAMKRVKTYLRSTMSNNRLNHLMCLYVHRCRFDELD